MHTNTHTFAHTRTHTHTHKILPYESATPHGCYTFMSQMHVWFVGHIFPKKKKTFFQQRGGYRNIIEETKSHDKLCFCFSTLKRKINRKHLYSSWLGRSQREGGGGGTFWIIFIWPFREYMALWQIGRFGHYIVQP